MSAATKDVAIQERRNETAGAKRPVDAPPKVRNQRPGILSD